MTASFTNHAIAMRRVAKDYGLADCIHYAPDWSRRADAIYAEANGTRLPWWETSVIGLLPDGRMALVSDVVCVVEPTMP